MAGFERGESSDLHQLAASRPYNLAGLRWANARGVLVFGTFAGGACYGARDCTGRVLELRRVDVGLFDAVPRFGLDARKSHAMRGSQKNWPVGIQEASVFPSIALVEGLPDFLTAHGLILWEQAKGRESVDVACAPVAMLSASVSIHTDALSFFHGKRVRIFAHSERAGLEGAERWRRQISEARALAVDIWDFGRYRKADGAAVNDLWEMEHSLASGQREASQLWRMLP